MFILLNGPLGIGKSTLAEALTERIDRCVMLDGDHVVAVNPPHDDDYEHLHATLAVLVEHHRRYGYRHFVIDHYWPSPDTVDDLRQRMRKLDPQAEFRAFLLRSSVQENLARIKRRQTARAIDERNFERRTVTSERESLYRHRQAELGEDFDVSGPVDALVETLLGRLGFGTDPTPSRP